MYNVLNNREGKSITSPKKLPIENLPPCPRFALAGRGEGVVGAAWPALPKVVLKLLADPDLEIGWPPGPSVSLIYKTQESILITNNESYIAKQVWLL